MNTSICLIAILSLIHFSFAYPENFNKHGHSSEEAALFKHGHSSEEVNIILPRHKRHPSLGVGNKEPDYTFPSNDDDSKEVENVESGEVSGERVKSKELDEKREDSMEKTASKELELPEPSRVEAAPVEMEPSQVDNLKVGDDVEFSAQMKDGGSMKVEQSAMEPESQRVEEKENEDLNAQIEAKMLSDADKAFQEFDKSAGEAQKQNEAVEAEVMKDLDDQNQHQIRDQ